MRKLTCISLPYGTESVGDYAFSGCTRLSEINIPQTVTYVGQDAFADTALAADRRNYENGAFYLDGCLITVEPSAERNFEIRDGTRLIAEAAFYFDAKFDTVYIPNSVAVICPHAFLDFEQTVIICEPGSAAESFARENGLTFRLIGDADGSGTTDADDLVFLRGILLGRSGNADANRDGKTDIKDLIRLKKMLAV